MSSIRGVIPAVLNNLAPRLLGFCFVTYWRNSAVSIFWFVSKVLLLLRSPSYDPKKNSLLCMTGPPMLPAKSRYFWSTRCGHLDAVILNCDGVPASQVMELRGVTLLGP